MKRRHLLTTATASAGLLALPAIAMADTLSDIKSRGFIRVGIDLSSPPYGTTNAQMQPIGSEVERAKLLAKYLGVKLKIVNVTSPNRIPFLLAGKADVIMASLSITPSREKVIDFSRPYGVIPILVAAPKSVKITSLADLKGKTIATTRGSTNDAAITAAVPDAHIVRYDDDATLVTALVTGQNNIMCSSNGIEMDVNKRRPQDPLETKIILKLNPFGAGIRKGEPALKKALDAWIAADLKNGELNAIYKKYNGMNLPATMPS